MHVDIPFRRPLRSSPGALLGVLLLIVDLALIAIHIRGDLTNKPENWLWWVDLDGGHPELMQYVKLLWVCLLLGTVWWRWRRMAWFTVALASFAILSDDVLALHERFGPAVGQSLPLPAALVDYADFVGEFFILAGAGAILLILVVVGYLRADGRTREWLHPFLILLVVLAFLGAVLDALHQTTEGLLYQAGTLVEDGGEMVVVTLLTAYAFQAAAHATGRVSHPEPRPASGHDQPELDPSSHDRVRISQ